MIRSFTIIFLLLAVHANSQILSECKRADLVNQVLQERFETILPNIMDRTGIDMWVLISREYNEDPVMRTMLPAEWLNARRRTILVFYWDAKKNKLQKMAIARYDIGDNIKSVWDKEKQPDQWKALAGLIEQYDPKKIGIDYSEDFAIADGIVKTDYDAFMNAIPKTYQDRIVSAEKLAIGWVETRTPLEMRLYEELVNITHTMIKKAFSSALIKPGETTTDDVVWNLRQQVTDSGLETWFHPTVDIQRSDEELASHITSFSSGYGDKMIQPGDLLHCDFGISYLRLNTDCQQHAYVLKENETEAPQFLKDAFAKGNQLQDILTSNFKTGKTGNEILSVSLEEAKSEGLQPSIYTHPLGLFGHSAGPTIGMWDSQGGVPGTGDYQLYENTVYAIELNTTVNLPEWKKDIRIMLEEAGFWGKKGFDYVGGRQEKLLLVN